ncbi:MAG TPA: hypothetical protein VGR37_01750 [Longimicrobiaceae bacterium]|nr:hypothetical protein [Longimicrobiaceae bacterium]
MLRWAAWALAVISGLYVLGLIVTRLVVGSGLERVPLDPRQQEIARFALENAWLNNDNPIARVLLPAARVERIRYVPGPCPLRTRTGERTDATTPAFEAYVRFYWLYAVPGPVSRVDCSSVSIDGLGW